MTELETFREETRAWLEAHCPRAMREPVDGVEQLYWGGRKPGIANPDQKLWCDRMADRGWTAPTWPRAYGGGGLSPAEHTILQEEMTRIGARKPLMSFGLMMLGPVLLKYGTEAQKHEHLPKICRGEIRWCQGYSEPNAGSDLASLQTRAENRGDHYVINGQKIWTSYAHKSDWIFCLVRSGNGGSKHAGVSFMLVDMDQPGVTVRPIKLISGASAFCETFFDDARAETSNLIGEEGGGWGIAKYLLTHERSGVSFASASTLEDPLPRRALRAFGSDAEGRLKNGVLRTKIAQLELDAEAFAATSRRIREELASGQGLGVASSILKYYGTELNKRREELIVAVAGEPGLAWESGADGEGKIARDWLRSRANSIEGGSSEIQLNIIAKRVLGLPDA